MERDRINKRIQKDLASHPSCYAPYIASQQRIQLFNFSRKSMKCCSFVAIGILLLFSDFHLRNTHFLSAIARYSFHSRKSVKGFVDRWFRLIKFPSERFKRTISSAKWYACDSINLHAQQFNWQLRWNSNRIRRCGSFQFINIFNSF